MTSFNLGAALQNYKAESEITLLDAGTHTLEVTSAKAGTAKAGPTITPVYKVHSGPYAGKRVMTGKISFAETALWKTFPLLEGFGISQDFILQANSQPDPIKAIADAMVGRIVDATVSVDNWNGEDRNKLDKVKLATAAQAVAPPLPPTPAPAQTVAPVLPPSAPEPLPAVVPVAAPVDVARVPSF